MIKAYNQFFRDEGRASGDGYRDDEGHDERGHEMNAANGERYCFCVYALEFSPTIVEGTTSG